MLSLDDEHSALDGKAGKTASTITAQFTKQMGDLYSLVSQDTKPHFIRCLKPNTVAKPQVFENQMSMRQMRYSSLFGVCQVRQMGFPERFPFQEFLKKFGFLCPAAKDHEALVKGLHGMGAMKTGHFALGHDKVFVRADVPHFLEFEWQDLSKHAISLLDCNVRMSIKRLGYVKFKGYLQDLRSATKQRTLATAEETVKLIKRVVSSERKFQGYTRHAAWIGWLASEAELRQEALQLGALSKALLEQDLDAINTALEELQKFTAADVLMAKKEVKEAGVLRDALVLVVTARKKLGEAIETNNLQVLMTAMEALEQACMDARCSKTAFDSWEEVVQAKALREDLEEQERVRVLLKEAVSDGTLPALATALAAAEALRRKDLAEDIDTWSELKKCQAMQRTLLGGSVKQTLATILQKIEVRSLSLLAPALVSLILSSRSSGQHLRQRNKNS